MNINQAIEDVSAKLKWKVEKKKTKAITYEIQSNPYNRTHTIYLSEEIYGISHEYAKLHELVHAYLGETICILMSTQVFTPEEKEFFSKYNFVHYIASDWFVDNYCIRLIGIENFTKYNDWISYLKMHKYDINISEDAEEAKKFVLGYSCAILDVNGIDNVRINLRTVNKVKKTLMKSSTEPTKENYLKLFNELLKIVTNEQVVVKNIDGIEMIMMAQ